MSDDRVTPLLEDTLPHLRRYRALLLESRSGAASEAEQDALALGALIRNIEQALTKT